MSHLTPLFKNAVIIFFTLIVAMPASAQQNVFTVNSNGDGSDISVGDGVCEVTSGGVCTLRAAIEEANAHSNLAGGPDRIEFSIPGAGPHTIQPLSTLPIITDAVVIDGGTQPGADCNVWPPTLKIELDGTNAGGGTRGLELLGASGSTIRGLVINRFGDEGIRVFRSNDSHIECNFVGTDISGSVALGNNNHQIVVFLSSRTTIGGAIASARNLVSGSNTDTGIRIVQGDATRVLGNFVGTDVSGTQPLGNNVGIEIFDSDHCTIGGTGSGEGNIIAFSRLHGVIVSDPNVGHSINNAILGNSIFSNGTLGIDLSSVGVTANDAGDGDIGPNNLQNFPEITSATTTGSSITIAGTFNSTPSTTDFRLEFFANSVCNGDQSGTPDADDYGEGETFLGADSVDTDGSGDASFSFTFNVAVPAGAFMTATATSPDSNTSEFAQCVEAVLQQTLPHDFLFLAEEFVESKKHKLIQGDVHSNNDIIYKKGKKSDHIGDLFAVDDIDIGKKNDVEGNVTAGDDVDNDGDVSGAITENAAVAVVPLPVIGPFAVGTTSIEVAKKATLPLAPGSYGNVEVEKQGTLELTSGTYFMKSLELNKKTKLIIDVSSGLPVIINISDDLVFGKRSEVIIEPNGETDSELVTFNFADDDDNNGDDDFVEIGKKAKVLGTIIAPDAWVVLQSKSRFKGAICAENIVVKSKVVALHHSVTASLPKIAPDDEDEEEELTLTSVPTEFELGQNYPNPFNPSTTVSFALPQAGEISLRIYNLRGQLVVTLVSKPFAAGQHKVVWDGKDARGAQAASGIYVYRLEADGFIATKKLTLMK